MMKRIPALAIAATTCLALTACGGGSTDSSTAPKVSANCKPKHDVKTITPGELSVAAYVYPPFSDVKGSALGGAEGEIITKIAAMECLNIKVVPGAAAAMIPSITAGRADTTIGSWYRTAERAKVVQLSDPVIADRLILISKAGTSSVADLKGQKVGSILGFLWNDDLKKLLGGDIKLYETAQAMYADLSAGRIEVVVDTYPSAQSLLKKTPISGLQFKVPPADPAVVSTQKPGQTNFPVSLKNTALADAFNADLAEMRSSGELKKIVVSFGFQAEAADPGQPNLL